MRAAAIASLAFFGIAAAQDLGQLPTCATTCLTKFTGGGEIGGCPQLDAKCICASTSFIDSIACCLADVCSPEDQKTAVKFASTFCGTQGVQVPNAVVCKSSSSALPSATLAPSGTASASASGTAQVSTTAASSTPTASTENKPPVAPTANPQNAGPQNAVAPGFAGLLGSLAAALAFL